MYLIEEHYHCVYISMKPDFTRTFGDLDNVFGHCLSNDYLNNPDFYKNAAYMLKPMC